MPLGRLEQYQRHNDPVTPAPGAAVGVGGFDKEPQFVGAVFSLTPATSTQNPGLRRRRGFRPPLLVVCVSTMCSVSRVFCQPRGARAGALDARSHDTTTARAAETGPVTLPASSVSVR